MTLAHPFLKILCDQCQINLKDNNFPTFVFLQLDVSISCSPSDGLSFSFGISFICYGIFLFWTFFLNRQNNQRYSPDCTQINYILFEWHHPLSVFFFFFRCKALISMIVSVQTRYVYMLFLIVLFWTQCVTSDKCTIIKRSLLYYAWTGLFQTFFNPRFSFFLILPSFCFWFLFFTSVKQQWCVCRFTRMWVSEIVIGCVNPENPEKRACGRVRLSRQYFAQVEN